MAKQKQKEISLTNLERVSLIIFAGIIGAFIALVMIAAPGLIYYAGFHLLVLVGILLALLGAVRSSTYMQLMIILGFAGAVSAIALTWGYRGLLEYGPWYQW